MRWFSFTIFSYCFFTSPIFAGVDFSRDVLPILSENCFHCHGPDEGGRKGNYRLDTKEGAFRAVDGVSNIIPGKSADSELHRRLLSGDTEEQMPPPKSNRKLTKKQIETIQKWIDEGAKWGQHWAYQALPKTVALPTVKNEKWVRKPIDRFILNKIEAKGWQPATEAAKERWLRRVTFDLTGFPPSQAEQKAYFEDKSQKAEETVVDRLLGSQRFGERMAVDWLDLARYADTHGYQSDRTRTVWQYRDWVIKAFNQNMSFDQFLTWQLAGDLLPNATQEQKLATAFNRLHMQNEEGGIVEEEFRVAYVVDRVNTFGTTFLAQTLECCRCHDHKYDPLSQKDFYSLFAFFQNIDESGQTTYFTPATPVPTLIMMNEAETQKHTELIKLIENRKFQLQHQTEQAKKSFEMWLKTKPKIETIPGLVASFDFDSFEKNQIKNSVNPTLHGLGVENPKLAEGKFGKATVLNGEDGFNFPNLGHFNRTDRFSFTIRLKPTIASPRQVVFHHSMAPIDAGSRGYELLLEDNKVAFGLHHMWPGNSLKVRSKNTIPLNDWTDIAISYDGSSQAKGLAIYFNGEPIEIEVIRDGLTKDITYGNEPNLMIGHRFRDNGFKGGMIDQFCIYNRKLTPLEIAGLDAFNLATTNPKPSQQPALFDYFLEMLHGPTIDAMKELQRARAEENRFITPLPEMMVMREMAQPKPAFILKRGNYDQLGNPVVADTPSVMPKMLESYPRNRLGLAKWLTDPGHPLTARVTVNRLWQQMFGKGLVESSDNFGSTGSTPTHPELLDWLARDLITSGWDIKRLLKEMALSATYRQGSKTTAEIHSQDPYNELLARASVRRLTAEMLRDQAIIVSGMLNEKVGGPSVYPYQPEGVWSEAVGRPNYPQSKGADLYRRSLYSFWKRTAPPPAMLTFDAPERSNCIAKRQSTSTPLQALVLLNDVQFVEAAKQLGQRMLQEGGETTSSQITWLTNRVIGRSPTENESKVLFEAFLEQQLLFQQNGAAAKKILSIGESKIDPKLMESKLAAATQIVLMVLNFDEAVNRR
jgi:hypothetical protein